MSLKTKSAFDISLGLLPDPINGQEIKSESQWVPLESLNKQVKELEVNHKETVDLLLFANNVLLETIAEKDKRLEKVNKIADEMEHIYDEYIAKSQLEGVRGSLFYDFSKRLRSVLK